MRGKDFRTVYLGLVRRKLHCPAATKKQLLSGLKMEITDVFETSPTDFSVITDQFGLPGEMALELESALSHDVVEQYIKQQKWLCWLGLAVGIIAVALLIWYIVWVATYDFNYVVKQVTSGG